MLDVNGHSSRYMSSSNHTHSPAPRPWLSKNAQSLNASADSALDADVFGSPDSDAVAVAMVHLTKIA